MGDLDYGRLGRVLVRCEELGTAEATHEAVRLAFADLLRAPAQDYLAALDALVDAESAASKEGGEAKKAITAITPSFNLARSVIQAYLPAREVPPPLPSQRTDTDKKGAIGAVFELLERNASEPWAKLHLEGEFGRLAPIAEREMLEWTIANTALAEASLARARAYGPAWERYLAFKSIVRNAYGRKSKQYQRIHIRFAHDEATTEVHPAEVVAE